ncbi:MAG TPA: beta-ketoacyl synthase N-terminal-like domain-containing protein [Verrucomicrobiae bacterium]|nr:beta-ketoacyl synthase N-terminal-like domain-containing protein [Verrucomicrobiae bacterium]
MSEISVIATSTATAADLPTARLGQRFGRLDLQSQLALLAVASLNINFDELARDRIGICLAASAGSLSTDVNFWNGRNGVGGPSPTLFAYTLPSAAVGEVAIHFRLTGPNLCFVGDNKIILSEAADMLRRGEADACVCIFCEAVTPECGQIISVPPTATARAFFLKNDSEGTGTLAEFDRDIKALSAIIFPTQSAG